jgi:hypothetical protein
MIEMTDKRTPLVKMGVGQNRRKVVVLKIASESSNIGAQGGGG